jgi:predicted lysophospholipase L1 biosynthesis ABC-type transport system permease subunit
LRTPTSLPGPDIYVPLGQFGPAELTVAMRTGPGVAPPDAATIRDIVRELDPGLPVIGLETFEGALRSSVAPARFYLHTMAIFAALALILACVGLYGVVAYVVSQRGREIGIRMALGARGEQVVRLMLRQGLVPAGLGMIIGLVLALALGRVAESLLFQVSPRDPAIMAAVVVVLGAVVLAAALLPAIRASRVDPASALRIDAG